MLRGTLDTGRRVKNCTRSHPLADAVCAHGPRSFSLDPERLVWFCTLSGNSAADSGGAIYNTGSGNVTLTVSDCTLSGNTAGSAGGGIGIGDGDVILSQCSVTGNSAYQGGEGVLAKHLSSTYRPGRRSAAWRKIKPRPRGTCQKRDIFSY